MKQVSVPIFVFGLIIVALIAAFVFVLVLSPIQAKIDAQTIAAASPSPSPSLSPSPNQSAETSASPSTNQPEDYNKPKIENGETIAADTEFQVKAGDVVSGDVYHVTADHTKVAIMDDDETTALVIIFTKGARLKTGPTWGRYLIHQASDEEIKNAVAEKEQEGFEKVDLIKFPDQKQKKSSQ